MRQTERSLQEYRTTLPSAEVIAQAKNFFAKRNSIYAAFLDKEGPTYVTFRGQGGEEVVIATSPVENGTLVTGSTYLFDMQVARFFATLPPFELAERLAGPTLDAPPAPAAPASR
jgi:hypothetical protein